MQSTPVLVSPDWVMQHLNEENIMILDASMTQIVGRPPIVYPAPIFIPCAIAFDLESVFIDPHSPLPHTLPTPERFTQLVRALGVESNTHVLIYDNQGIYSSPRAWWMFRVMGHERVSVIDGGLPGWIKRGYPTQMQLSNPLGSGNFTANFQSEWLKTKDQIVEALSDERQLIIDARAAARFLGQMPEPRPGVSPGHIPGSVNLPFLEMMEGDGYCELDELRLRFERLNIADKSLIFSCGSGVTACILLLAAALLGYQPLAVYDGSWAEWGADQ